MMNETKQIIINVIIFKNTGKGKGKENDDYHGYGDVVLQTKGEIAVIHRK